MKQHDARGAALSGSAEQHQHHVSRATLVESIDEHHVGDAALVDSVGQHHLEGAALVDSMKERQFAEAASIGSMKRHYVGGAALIAFGLVLWTLFLGTVGRPNDVNVHETTRAVRTLE